MANSSSVILPRSNRTASTSNSMDTLDEDRKCIYKDTGEVLQTEYTFAQEIVTREQIEEEMSP